MKNFHRETIHIYTVIFEPAVEGGYTVSVPALPGVITEGDTLSEARQRVKEAIRGYLTVLKKHDQSIPVEKKFDWGRPIAERIAVSV